MEDNGQIHCCAEFPFCECYVDIEIDEMEIQQLYTQLQTMVIEGEDEE